MRALFKNVMILLAFILLNGCAPFMADNYLSPSTIKTPQKINGKWQEPKLIPINAEALNTPEGRRLLAPTLRPKAYRVGSYDSLNIIVWGHPEISTVPTSTAATPGSRGIAALMCLFQPVRKIHLF